MFFMMPSTNIDQNIQLSWAIWSQRLEIEISLNDMQIHRLLLSQDTGELLYLDIPSYTMNETSKPPLNIFPNISAYLICA